VEVRPGRRADRDHPGAPRRLPCRDGRSPALV